MQTQLQGVKITRIVAHPVKACRLLCGVFVSKPSVKIGQAAGCGLLGLYNCHLGLCQESFTVYSFCTIRNCLIIERLLMLDSRSSVVTDLTCACWDCNQNLAVLVSSH